MKSGEFDFIVVCIAGWIPSWAVIKTVHQFSHKPMLLWGLTGYYEDGKLLTTADQAGTAALRKVFEDMRFRFKYVYNMPDKNPWHKEDFKLRKIMQCNESIKKIKNRDDGLQRYEALLNHI